MEKVSIIVPVYNEESGLREFYDRLSRVLDKESTNFEIIFVNDGGYDGSLECMKGIQARDRRVKILDLTRNFGNQIAVSAGIDYASGDAVITMDADLQHPPELIPQLIKKWKEGHNIVLTVREYDRNESASKKIASKLFFRIISKISNLKMSVNAVDYRLLDGRVVRDYKKLKERSRFVRGLVDWLGYNKTELKFVAPPRYVGKTKFNTLKLLRLAIDAITSFSWFPLQLAIYVGFIISFLSFIYLAYAIYIKIFVGTILGWTSILATVLLLGGVQLIFLGIIGEYIGRIFEEVKQRPLYLIKEMFGFEEDEK